jgi:hypothetical protein
MAEVMGPKDRRIEKCIGETKAEGGK